MEATLDNRLSRLRQGLPARLKASGIHFALSAVIFAAALYLILVHWYPGFHFAVDGGWQGVRIMIGVDLVLGPALTLVIFNPFKARRLIVFDLVCIGLTQLGALIWGFYAIESQRPVAVSYQDGSFYVVTAEPLAIERYDEAQLATLSERRPALVYVAPPADEDEETRMAMQEVVGGIAPHEDPFFFRPFAQHWPQVLARGTPDGDRVRFPYQGRYGTCTLVFTRAGALQTAEDCAPL